MIRVLNGPDETPEMRQEIGKHLKKRSEDGKRVGGVDVGMRVKSTAEEINREETSVHVSVFLSTGACPLTTKMDTLLHLLLESKEAFVDQRETDLLRYLLRN